MSGAPLILTKDTSKFLVDQLSSQDIVSIITYDQHVCLSCMLSLQCRMMQVTCASINRRPISNVLCCKERLCMGVLQTACALCYMLAFVSVLQVNVVSPPMHATPENKAKLTSAINAINVGAGTNLCEALTTGVTQQLNITNDSLASEQTQSSEQCSEPRSHPLPAPQPLIRAVLLLTGAACNYFRSCSRCW
jgi:hypothetical protein